MLQSNNIKSSNNITNSQVANKSDKSQVSPVALPVANDAILQYPFIDSTDLHSMRLNYNLYVDQYNKKIESGEIKDRETVKPSSELVFVVLVGFFASQLKTRNASKLNLRQSTATTINYLDDIDVRSDHFADHTIEVKGEKIPRLGWTSRTIRNHITRLHEAGVITKRFRGTKLAVKISFNPEVLQISDADPTTGQKTQTLGLQGGLWKVFPNSIDSPSIYLNNNKRKEISIQNLSIKEFSQKSENEIIASAKATAQTPAVGFTGTPGAITRNSNQQTEKNQGGGQKFDFIDNKLVELDQNEIQEQQPVKKYQPISAKLLASDDNDYYQLAQLLSAGKFNNYTPINLEYLKRELDYGNLTIAEFKRVLLVDFAKMSSKIWKTKNVYPGVWVKALRELEKYFTLSSGNYKVQKQQLVRMIEELRYRINYAIRWFADEKRKDLNPLFPHFYFDISRTSPKEIGFRYTKKRWKQHAKYEHTYKLEAGEKNTRRKKMVTDKNQERVWLNAVNRYKKSAKGYETIDGLIEFINLRMAEGRLSRSYTQVLKEYVFATENANKFMA